MSVNNIYSHLLVNLNLVSFALSISPGKERWADTKNQDRQHDTTQSWNYKKFIHFLDSPQTFVRLISFISVSVISKLCFMKKKNIKDLWKWNWNCVFDLIHNYALWCLQSNGQWLLNQAIKKVSKLRWLRSQSIRCFHFRLTTGKWWCFYWNCWLSPPIEWHALCNSVCCKGMQRLNTI